MRSRSRSVLTTLASVFLVLGFALPALAADVESSDLVIITEDDVITGDLYVAANRVIIRGTVDGDLIAIAGEDVRIEGEVTGSLMALAPEVVIEGAVDGSVRVTAPNVDVLGVIGRDLVAFGGDVILRSGAIVEGDVVVWAWDVSSNATVAGDFEGTIRHLSLAGTVDGDVRVTVRTMTVPSGLIVGGDLTYRSEDTAPGLDFAEVGGAIVQQSPLPPNIRVRALFLTGRILVAILLTAVALLVASAWPERSESALEGLEDRPLRSAISGFSILISPLVIALAAYLIFAVAPSSAALPLIAALLPILLATMGLVFVLGLVAGIPAVAWLGSRVKRKSTIAGAVGIGSVIVAVLWLLPYVGWLVALAVSGMGLGGWVTAFRAPPVVES